MHLQNGKLAGLIIATLLFVSCTKEKPMFLNNSSDLGRIQTKIEKLTSSQQIDSVSIRSTDRKSLVSSIFIVSSDSDNKNEYKNAIEFLPQQKLTMNEKSKQKKEALHSYKIDIPVLDQHIKAAKGMLPSGYVYRDIQSIRYSASPFGEKYYIGIEVSTADKYVKNDYIEVYYDKQQATFNLDGASQEQVTNMSNVFFIANFTVENNILNITKAENELRHIDEF